MKTIAKRIAGAALAVGMIGGAGLATAVPAAAGPTKYTMPEAPNKEACNMKVGIRAAQMSLSGYTIKRIVPCKLSSLGRPVWVGTIYYTK